MEEETFQYLWPLLKNHGGVAEFYEAEARALWNNYTREQQREIYRAIHDKLKAGKFVHYVPTKAISENAPDKNRSKS